MKVTYFDVQGILSYPISLTFGTATVTPITRIQYTHVYLIRLILDLIKELPDTDIFVFSLPDDILHVFRQLCIRRIDGDLFPGTHFDQIAQVHTELLRSKWSNGPISDRFLMVRDNKILVYSCYFTEPLAFVTSAKW